MERWYYENQLDLENFIHMLDDTTECYKFYWLDSIMLLLSAGKTEMEFDEIINGMIADAWYSVSEYHLRLGPKDANGDSMNSLERIVCKLMSISDIKSSASREEIISIIKKNERMIHNEKYQISKNVPYRLLSSFLKEIGGNDKIWNQQKRLIAYIEFVSENKCIPYKICDAAGLKRTIHISPYWKEMLLDNMVTIRGWIQLKKVRYLQNRNPGVPGIIYKLEPENEKFRKMKHVRELWHILMEQEEIMDIYSNNRLKSKDFEVDHFVPWSYIANDEMWNLIPMESRLNSSKSNKLPDWEKYFPKFAGNQYLLYENIQKNQQIKEKFKLCRRDNIVSIWANEELYISGNSKEVFYGILEKNLKPIYDGAKMQGYGIWNMDLEMI